MQRPEKVPVLVHDVAAYFSGEDWKLLHEWQKELYRNVMNEIHQALISLGPLIATTVSSLRAKEKEDLYPVCNQDSVNHSTSDTNSNVIFGINQEIKQHLLEPLDKDRMKSNDCLSTVDTHSNSEASFGINREKEPYQLEPHDMDRRESDDCLSTEHGALLPIVSFIIKEERILDGMDRHRSEGEKSIRNATGIHFISTEAEASSVDHLGAKAAECRTDTIAGDWTINPKMKGEDFAECIEKSRPCKPASEKEKVDMFLSSKAGVPSRSKLCLGSNLGLAGDGTARYESGFSSQVHFNFHQVSPKVKISDASHEYNLGNENRVTGTQNTNQIVKLLSCAESSSHNEVVARYHNAHTIYQDIQCEKSFRQKTNLILHQRIHSGERPFQCPECKKSFSQKRNLTSHQRIHTRERPYQCIACKQRFVRKDNLTVHERIHTGVKPYQCSVCKKNFTVRGNLVVHQRMHSGERPYQCIECGKGFSYKTGLTRHKRTHMRVNSRIQKGEEYIRSQV